MPGQDRMQKLFMRAYEQHSDAIFRHCYFRISDRERAQELMQDTFTKTWDYLIKGNDVENLRAFLYQTARNLVIDEYRRRKPEASLEKLQEEKGFDPASNDHKHIGESFDLEVLKEALDVLEEEYREVVTLRYIDGLKPRQIAKLLDQSPNLVSVRIHRGIAKVRQHLEKKEQDPNEQTA